MFLSSRQEIAVFLSTIAGGGVIGITVDLFRIIRRSFKTASRLVWLQDILMWCAVFAEVCATLYMASSGEVRWYSLLGFAVGFVLYVLTVSRYVISLAVSVVGGIRSGLQFALRLVAVPFLQIKRIMVWLWRKFVKFSKKFHILFRKN